MIAVPITIVVSVTIAMIVAPGPIFLLFLGAKLSEVPMTVAMGLIGPTAVIHHLVVVPRVIVGVVGIVSAIVMVMFASQSCQ